MDNPDFIRWTPELATGIEELDEQHRSLITLLISLYELNRISDPRREAEKIKVEDVLNTLIAYAKLHFTTEERWMEEHAFPDLNAHKAEHEYFIARVLIMRRNFRAHKGNGRPTLQDVLTFIRDWVVSHLLHTDAEYAQFYRKKLAS